MKFNTYKTGKVELKNRGRTETFHTASAYPVYGIPMGTKAQRPRCLQPRGNDFSKSTCMIKAAAPGPSRAGYADGLVQCAGVIYFYMGPNETVRKVGIFHAMSGDIPDDYGPLGKLFDPDYDPKNIRVVFASARDAKTWGGGLFTIRGQGVPLENILVFENVSEFGANIDGEFGVGPSERWGGPDDLRDAITRALNNAEHDYRGQFPHGRTQLGLLGSQHNLTEAMARLAALRNNLAGAGNDERRLTALANFFSGPHSFKAGSLKLLVIQRLYPEITGQAAALTHANGEQQARMLIRQIRSGQI